MDLGNYFPFLTKKETKMAEQECKNDGDSYKEADYKTSDFNAAVRLTSGSQTDDQMDVAIDKTLRRSLDRQLQYLKESRPSRERSLAITKLQEAVMWLGMDLKRIGNTPNPYPNSKDPTNAIVDPTADGLKL